MKTEWNKWKNHFYQMKGGVGMSGHEKEREQEDAYTKTESHSSIYIFVSFKTATPSCRHLEVKAYFPFLCPIVHSYITNKTIFQHNNVGMGKYERVSTVTGRDGVMNDFLSWCMHLLVPFLFHDLISLYIVGGVGCAACNAQDSRVELYY